jgi:hypothetical protein
MLKNKILITLILNFFLVSATGRIEAQNLKADGYKGIWFTLGQFSEYGDKYSGGLGTYTADHIPIAIYSPVVDKTFFVYGGTTKPNERHLLIMISYYDHKTKMVPQPVIVYDKAGVNDPHDDAAISIDENGYIWVFVSGRSTLRKGLLFKSLKPFAIDSFEKILDRDMTYPQPWYIPGEGFFYMFTKYTNGRELYWSESKDGKAWSADSKLAGMGGHYQVTNMVGKKLVSVFNYHPGGDVDKRTNIYAVQTDDLGKTWKTINGGTINTPLTDHHNPALIKDYESEHKLVYINDLGFDKNANPVILAIISRDFRPGPAGDPREWMIIHWNNGKWNFHKVCESTHNYDMGSLYIEKDIWRIIGPTEPGPQKYGTGGEMAMWTSKDMGITWEKILLLTNNSLRNNSYARRPLNANEAFYALWADGDADELSESHLYFSNKTGDKVYELPYEMKNEFEKPVIRNPEKTQPATRTRQHATGDIRKYPLIEGSVKSPLFSVAADDLDIFTEQYKTFHYANFEAGSAFSVTLKSKDLITDIKVSPSKFNISAKAGEKSTSFKLPGPGFYVVRINKIHKLFILADKPEQSSAKNGINVLSLGIDNTGKRIETTAIQKALNDIKGSDRTLFFPAGIYKTGSLSIPSDTRIYLDAGAILKAVDDISSFCFGDKIKPVSFIRIKDAQNVEIHGRGIIDANGKVLREKYGDSARMRLILIVNSQDVCIDGIIIRDPGSWNTHMLSSQKITVSNVKMLNDIELANTDGFDPDGSKHVIIENCFAYCSDDNVAIKTTNSSGYLKNVEDIVVKGNVFLTKKSSLKVGTESRGEIMKDILFEDNDVVESDRGMSLYCSDGATYENIRYINNRFEDNYPDAKQSSMNFTIIKRNSDSKPGQMKNILIKDCSFVNQFPKQSEIYGFDENHRIEVTFENLIIGGKKCITSEEARIKANGFADIKFK